MQIRFGVTYLLATLAVFDCNQVIADDLEIEFTASVNESSVTLDESVELNLKIVANQNADIGEVRFNSPNFQMINEFLPGYSISATVFNGSLKTNVIQRFTKILKPLKVGKQRIANIRVDVDGKIYTAPDIFVSVLPSGAGTLPQNSRGNGVRGAAQEKAPSFLLFAETNKEDVYKGEQILLTYSLLASAEFFQLTHEKIPQLKGFLKQELQTPLFTNRLLQGSREEIIAGKPYRRILLLQYVVYPLQVGSQMIDSLGISFQYNKARGRRRRGNDPFDPFNDPFGFGLFNQSVPVKKSLVTKPVKMTVHELPEMGKPENFSGAVGKFEVMALADQSQGYQDEPVAITVKVEGKSDLTSLNLPEIKWPDGIEFYDQSQGSVSMGAGGVVTKIFEVVIVPRKTGTFKLPEMRFSYFDPDLKQYVERHTDKIVLEVLPPRQSKRSLPKASKEQKALAEANSTSNAYQRRVLRGPEGVPDEESLLTRLIDTLANFSWISVLLVGLSIFGDSLWKGSRRVAQRRETKRSDLDVKWKALRTRVKLAAKKGDSQLAADCLEEIQQLLYQRIDCLCPVGARAMPRSLLGKTLLDRNLLEKERWKTLESLLERIEGARYGAASHNKEIVSVLLREALALDQEIKALIKTK